MLAVASRNLEDLTQKVQTCSSELIEVENKLKSKKVLIKYYEKKDSTVPVLDAVAYLCEAIERACHHIKGKHASTKAKLLMDAISSSQLFKGEAASALSGLIRLRIRELFRSWKLVKAGDVSSAGSFKTSTINALHCIIDEKQEQLFPSATINRSRKLLDQYAAERIGCGRKETVYGEVYLINFEPAFCLLLKAYHLHDLAITSSVKVAITVDGADLFNDLTHVSTGIKITDERGIHPVTKQPFLFIDDDDAEASFIKIQSSEVCCITIIADARDNKQLYEDVFKDYYNWAVKLRTEGLRESHFGPELMPFNLTHTTDLKAA
jgi:hypothetical protein